MMLKTLMILVSSAAWSQITVPAESEPYTIIEAKVTTTMPPGAILDGGWTVPKKIDHRQVNSNMIYMTGPPGEYPLEYSGFWLHLGPEITVKDVNGVEQTFQPYLGHGRVSETEDFKIKGDVGPDPPGPDPPGPGPGPKQIMFFVVADQLYKLPSAQRELVTSLKIREELVDLGHKFLFVVDDDQINRTDAPEEWQPWLDSVRGDPLPRVAFASKKGGAITDFPLPANKEALIDLLNK
jgi:hypothetical protein